MLHSRDTELPPLRQHETELVRDYHTREDHKTTMLHSYKTKTRTLITTVFISPIKKARRCDREHKNTLLYTNKMRQRTQADTNISIYISHTKNK